MAGITREQLVEWYSPGPPGIVLPWLDQTLLRSVPALVLEEYPHIPEALLERHPAAYTREVRRHYLAE
jgi:hypothetical protein